MFAEGDGMCMWWCNYITTPHLYLWEPLSTGNLGQIALNLGSHKNAGDSLSCLLGVHVTYNNREIPYNQGATKEYLVTHQKRPSQNTVSSVVCMKANQPCISYCLYPFLL